MSQQVSKLAAETSTKLRLPAGVHNVCFHLTLGYCYKDVPDNLSADIASQLQSVVQQIGQTPIVFQPPALCYYNDMQKFIPWQGESNPFDE